MRHCIDVEFSFCRYVSTDEQAKTDVELKALESKELDEIETNGDDKKTDCNAYL